MATVTAPDLYAPFRPRRGRAVAMTMAGLSVVVFTGFAILAPMPEEGGMFGVGDRVMMAGLGLVIAAFLWRYVGIKAIPDDRGITVRNLLLSRRVDWDEVEAVRFHGGAAWPVLALHDGDEVAVMAVQKADGGSASGDATRLASLVEASRSRDDGPDTAL